MHAPFTAVPQVATAFLRRVSHRRAGLEGAPNSISEYIERRALHFSEQEAGLEGAPNSISEYIERRALHFSEQELEGLQSAIPAMREQLPGIANASARFPNLCGQLELLANLLEDAGAGTFGPISDALRREASFALFYVANEADIIPDSVPEIGYADDSYIVRTVLSRHLDVLVEYCEKRANPANNLVLEA